MTTKPLTVCLQINGCPINDYPNLYMKLQRLQAHVKLCTEIHRRCI